MGRSTATAGYRLLVRRTRLARAEVRLQQEWSARFGSRTRSDVEYALLARPPSGRRPV